MSHAMAFSIICRSSVLLSLLLCTTSWALTPSTKTCLHSPQNLSSIHSLCKSTPYPHLCFDSLKLSISLNIPTNIISFLLHSLQSTLSETAKLSDLFSSVNTKTTNIIEKQKGTIQDCKELHEITHAAVEKSVSKISTSKSSGTSNLVDVRAYLSAALTNKNTCLEGLDSASGPSKQALVDSIITTYQHVSNSLSIVSKSRRGRSKAETIGHHNRSLLEFPKWLSKKDRRILEDDYEAPTEVVLTVAADGSGNFTTISEAIDFAPNNSIDSRIFIYISQGVYAENIDIPSYKPNMVLLGDGSDVTFVTGNRSVGDGWTTFRSATVAVSAEGFLARDITIENTAGPEKHQAVALRINADFTAMYRCTINGYQDTLYSHSFRQFYRECDIYGTIDYIFGNAAVVFQGCNIVSKMPLPGQFTVITAQSRESLDMETGMALQNCSILATEDLYTNSSRVKSYLGRPWKVYSRTVYIESFIDDFISPEGWTKWSDDNGLDTLYYGEYDNNGPGSATDNRVTWPGYHIMDYHDASNFTVSDFISGQEWLDSTSFPYDDGV
ncbi:putative pectinesterase/pectinesterase inhibitor 12 [Apium graveolens]|uniref:putative pectinesterase/pectinesterase inhibitor 12 n=1 Tax=Apium graveolens TaxID=4045 RepID=UPI003D792CDE